MPEQKILAINPGSTSTKIAVFQNIQPIFLKNIKHPAEDLQRYTDIVDQYEYRKNIILKELFAAEIDLNEIRIIMGRGGLIKPVESGVYNVNERMKEDLRAGVLGEHASNLGGLIADDIARSLPNAKAYIADPVVVDELEEVARISGHPLFKRVSIFHALNQKAIARSYARSIQKTYEELNLIVAHLGGGISVGVHQKGLVIDVNQALDGEGPMSPERSGTLPAGALAKLCFSGGYNLQNIKKIITGEGGYVAYMGTNEAYKIEQMAKAGDTKAKLIQDALCYQVAKEIGAMATVLKGKVDAIILTGGIAYVQTVVENIHDRVCFIAPVVVYPGEDEMAALAMNGLRVINGEAEIKVYF
jgi:butyrate kinase